MKKHLVTSPYELNPGLDIWEELPPNGKWLTREEFVYQMRNFPWLSSYAVNEIADGLFGEESEG